MSEKTKCMEWIGPEREVPGRGVMRAGLRKEWPASIVDDLVNQGLAKEIPSLKHRGEVKKPETSEE